MSGAASSVERVKDRATGLDKFVLREARGSSVEVYLYGGQVTFWKNNFGQQLLFVSNKATFKPPKAIRGGIQICFPQLGNHGVLEHHGFARNRFWSVDESPPPFPVATSNCHIDLVLKSSQEDLKIWPHSYEFRLRIALSPRGDLIFTSRIKNISSDSKPFQFTFAYHTYFSVSDIRRIANKKLASILGDVEFITFRLNMPTSLQGKGTVYCLSLNRNLTITTLPCALSILQIECVGHQIDLHGPLATFSSNSLKHVFAFSEVRVEGLETLDYLDNLQSKKRCTEQGDAVVFESEVDKVYLSAPPKIVVIDHEKKRTFVLRKEGLPDVVVWNPWDKKAKAMPDFGDEEYKNMLCVGAAAIEKPITLKSGEEWIGNQEISAVPSSYSSGQLDPELIRRMHTI